MIQHVTHEHNERKKKKKKSGERKKGTVMNEQFLCPRRCYLNITYILREEVSLMRYLENQSFVNIYSPTLYFFHYIHVNIIFF